MESFKCLICGLDNCTKSSLKSGENLSKNLHVIFLLRNVLEVPAEKLINYLQTYPNLDSWLSVCDKCEGMVNNCKTIYQNILTAQSQFRKVKQELIQNIKESPFVKQEPFNHDGDDIDNRDHLINNIIVDDIRQHVYQSEYPDLTDPFISGDQLAYQHHQLSLKRENDDDNDNQSLFFENSEDDQNEDQEQTEVMEASTPVPVLEVPPPQKQTIVHENTFSSLSFPCPLTPSCQHRFINRPSLLVHLRQTHGTDPNLPPQIKKLINADNSVKKNLRRQFKCSKCGFKISSKEALDRHEKLCTKVPRVTGKKCWTCPVPECGEIFKTAGAVNKHIRKLHRELIKKDEPSEYICETCGGKFLKKDLLAQHRKHNIKCKMMRGEWREEDKVNCDICGKEYPSRFLMETHRMKVHEKRFGKKCELCGLVCHYQGELDRHMWSRHRMGEEGGGRKVEKCGVEGCEVVVRGNKWMEGHMRRMHGKRERRWRCEECGKKYLAKMGLKVHWRKEHGREMGAEGGVVN